MQLVDTTRYPVESLGSAVGQRLVADCVRSYANDGAVVLPGFLTADAVESIAREGHAQISRAFFCRSEHTVFLDEGRPGDGGNESDPFDPRRRMLQTSVGSIANDFLDPQGALQQLYEWAPLTAFIGAVLGHANFHRGADPLGALSINVYGQGDLHEWHFDESQFSVTIMIQEADVGGHFEYVSGLRSDGHVDIAGIQQVLDGDESQVQRLPFGAGSLSIFAGRNTLHRVTEVAGTRPRLVPVLTYATTPGSANSDAVRELFWGRTA